jgi:hypothetical protein
VRPEPAAAAPGVSPLDAGSQEHADLYSTQRFNLVFKVKEDALISVLNRLAALPLFAVVAEMEITKESPDVLVSEDKAAGPDEGGEARTGRSEAGAAEAPSRKTDLSAVPRQQRIVSGPSLEVPMLVRLGIDVYWFKGTGKAVAEEGGGAESAERDAGVPASAAK